jgi:hypothetical protein
MSGKPAARRWNVGPEQTVNGPIIAGDVLARARLRRILELAGSKRPDYWVMLLIWLTV